MNYYEHHLGDFMRDTAHLTMLEEAAYRRLLDAYYIRERALPADVRECCKLARAVSKPEREAVAYVLREFFTLKDDGHHQARADRELERYRVKSEKARASINQRWQRERETKAERTYERNTNVPPTEYERTTDDIHRAPVPSNQAPEVVGNLLLGAPQAAPRKRATRIPDGWEPGAEGLEFARSVGLVNGRAATELERFRDYWAAKAGQDATKADWQATWRNWCRKAAETGAGKAASQSSGGRHYEVI